MMLFPNNAPSCAWGWVAETAYIYIDRYNITMPIQQYYIDDIIISTATDTTRGQVLGRGTSDHAGHAVEYALRGAGVSFAQLREWCVSWPSDSALRRDIGSSTLYVTLEPSDERRG